MKLFDTSELRKNCTILIVDSDAHTGGATPQIPISHREDVNCGWSALDDYLAGIPHTGGTYGEMLNLTHGAIGAIGANGAIGVPLPVRGAITSDVLDEYMEKQLIKSMNSNIDNTIDPRSYIIFDRIDLSYWIKNRSFQRLMCNNILFNVTIIINVNTTTLPNKALPLTFWEKIDYMILCKEGIKSVFGFDIPPSMKTIRCINGQLWHNTKDGHGDVHSAYGDVEIIDPGQEDRSKLESEEDIVADDWNFKLPFNLSWAWVCHKLYTSIGFGNGVEDAQKHQMVKKQEK